MTDERQDDEFVSARYRELARETTPAHLDEKVLRRAANRAEHPGWSRSVRWTRPLAWAATIALCLAITLQVSRGPGLEMPVIETALEEAELAPPKQEQAKPLPVATPADKEQAKSLPAAAPAEKESLQSDAFLFSKQVAEEPRRTVRERQDTDAVEFEVKDSAALQRAEDLALLQSGNSAEEVVLRDDIEEIEVRANSADVVRLQPSAALALRPTACSEQSRETPEAWLECIEAFEDSDNIDAAAREKELLIAVFPDFKIP